MKKKIYLLGILASREKQCSASQMDICLQGWCDDMWVTIVVIKAKIHMHTNNNNEWGMAT